MKKRSLMALLLVAMLCFGMVGGAYAEQTTYTGSAQGFGSEVTVEVTLEDGKVVGLTVDDSGESYPSAGISREDSVDKLIAAILEQGGIEGIDASTGATFTSTAILNVVAEALNGGKAEAADVEIAFTPGTYKGTGMGRAGSIEVEVTVDAATIETIQVGANAETVGVKELAFQGLRDEILAHQSLGVDAVAGATMTSRGFIDAVADALTQAGGEDVVAALRAVPVSHTAPVAEDIDTQVVVVGAGMSGLIAALSAADAGAQVTLVEKMPFAGGNLFLAGGGLGTVDAETVDENDDLQRTLDYFRMVNETSERQPDYEFIEKLLPETGRAIDWLTNTFGLQHTSTDRGDYVRTNFGTPQDSSGSAFAGQLTDLVVKNGVNLLLNTRAESIVMVDGAAKGVRVSNASGEYTINADKVIIAAGGTSRDWDRLTAANPELNVVKYFEEAAVSSTGDGFAMLEDVGAQMDVGPYVKSAYPDISITFGYTFCNSPTQQNQIVVNADGQRVANESPYNQMYFNKQMLRQASPAYYAIYEPRMMADYFLADCERLAENEDNNVVVKADTLEELAAKMDVDYAALRETIDHYNELCAAGEDTDFGKDASHLVAYTEEGPLYAVRVYCASWGTIGGAVTDDTFHVLDASGAAIDNLFAVGECSTARLFGDYYFGGFSLGFYTAAGHIAGETAVAEING